MVCIFAPCSPQRYKNMNSSMVISREKLLTLRKLLPHGSVKLIAKRVGCSIETASMALNGKIEHLEVIKEALRIIKKKKSVVAEIVADVDKVLS